MWQYSVVTFIPPYMDEALQMFYEKISIIGLKMKYLNEIFE